MKKTILFLLLLATLAVVSWYFFPEKIAPLLNNNIIPPSGNGQEVIIEDIPGDDSIYAHMPEQPVADVENAIYEDFSEVVDADIYEIIPQSSVGWVRRDEEVAYPGKIMLERGTVAVKDGTVVAGAFVFDMGSLTLDVANEEILIDIKSAEYLDVEKYPQASFILQEVFEDKMSGILTLKGISKKVTFPSLVIMTENKIRIFSDFSIDKTEWGIIPTSPTLNIYLDLHLERILTKT